MEAVEHNGTRLLDIRDLHVTLGTTPVNAVRGISFLIRRGEVLGLAGESGSGKSVTAMTLTRLLPAEARVKLRGEILLDGEAGNLLNMRASELRRIRGRRISYVFQEPSSSFNPVISIGSQLREVLKMTGIPRKKRDTAAMAALGAVGIEPAKETLAAFPADFSGGMLQRLAIACAIAGKPDLLVADEPTTALDTSTQKRIITLLQQLNEERGMSILFISHDLALLKQIAPRLVVMREGEIVEAGSSEQLLHAPRHSYTQALVDAIPKLQLPR